MGQQLLSLIMGWNIRLAITDVVVLMCCVQVYRINKAAAEIANRACADVAESTGNYMVLYVS